MESVALEMNKEMIHDLSFEALEDVVAPGFWDGFLAGVTVAGGIAGGVGLGLVT